MNIVNGRFHLQSALHHPVFPPHTLSPASDPHHLGPVFMKNFNYTKVPEAFRQPIIDYAYQYGIPPEVLSAQIAQESAWNPTIKAGDYATTGSVGLSQATTNTWNGSPFGKTHPVTPTNAGTAHDPRNNPQLSIQFTAWLDRQGARAYPDTRHMLDTYNGGISSMGINNAEANNYVPAILRHLPDYQHDRSGILPPTPHL